ncbi:MAG: FtsQ-type POTRA domain-containing protein [Candidatus Paceibacterota bacterium]|jgi:cell division septal protein FtsQ
MRRLKAKRRKISRRRKKSIFTNLFFSVSLFASIILLSVAGFFLFSPRFQINSLNVSGNKDIPTEELKRVAEEKLKTTFSFMGFDFSTASIFLSGNKSINSLMESFPEIEKVTIKKNFPDGISLTIIEKTPFAVWTDDFDNSKCYLVDKSGSFIKNCMEEDYSSLIFVSEKEDIEKLDKEKTLESLSKIKEKLENNSINVSVFDVFEGKVSVKSNITCLIIFNINEDLDWQIEKLGIVLKDSKYSSDLNKFTYIDLRFGNQAIIK